MSPSVDPESFALAVFSAVCVTTGVVVFVRVLWREWREVRERELLSAPAESFPVAGLELDLGDVDWRWPAGQ